MSGTPQLPGGPAQPQPQPEDDPPDTLPPGYAQHATPPTRSEQPGDVPPADEPGRQAGRETEGPWDDDPDDDPEEDLYRVFTGAGSRAVRFSVYAPGANFNSGTMHGNQHVHNAGAPNGPPPGRRGIAHEGPIFAEEILAAQQGFAEPQWFPTAVRHLDGRLLVLTGEPGSGRRTAALNLLHRHTGSMSLRAVDSTVDLSGWRPEREDARGYLIDGLSQPQLLCEGWLVNKLVDRLREADACMVIVLPHDQGLARELRRAAHITAMTCEPPAAAEVFQARLRAAVPDTGERDRLLAAVDPGVLNDLLQRELAPEHVAELVDGLVTDQADLARVLERMSFLAEEEVPGLIESLRADPAGLAFLLAASVFEGLDYRIVREEAERLLELADGRLDAELPGTSEQQETRPNPHFVFAKATDQLLRDISARQFPREVRSVHAYSYSVEPVWFTRHGRSEAVLRYVWREYGQLSALMTDWLETVGTERELVEPVGRMMGMAARWGGGRRALSHIRKLAGSDMASSRNIAATAMGIAAEDPLLAGEIRYRLGRWSHQQSWQVRSTVARVCGTDYGFSRPEHALDLLGRVVHRHQEDAPERQVTSAVVTALRSLFASGSQSVVVARLSDWAEGDDRRASVALSAFPHLLTELPWTSEQLLSGSEAADQIIALVHRALHEDDHFERIRAAMLSWCRMATWDERWREALHAMLSALSHGMHFGVLRLFVSIDRDDDDRLAGKAIAQQAIRDWRAGRYPQHSTTNDSTQHQGVSTR